MKFTERKIKWIVAFPRDGRLQVKKGGRVKRGDVLVKYKERKVTLYSLAEAARLLAISDLKAMVEGLVGREVVADEVLGERKRMFGKSEWRSPGEGKILGIDEFGNLVLERVVGEREVRSPVTGRVMKIEEGKLFLEFGAVEIKGESLSEGKAWGESDFNEIDRIVDVNSEIGGKVMWLRCPDRVIMTKGLVLGAVGAVVAEGGPEDVSGEMPIMKIDKDVWEELVNGEERGGRIWINSKKRRLLLVLE